MLLRDEVGQMGISGRINDFLEGKAEGTYGKTDDFFFFF